MKTKLLMIAVSIFSMHASFAQSNISLSNKTDTIAPKNKVWLLRGNSGTDTAVNFIGTTDKQPLIFKVNNQKSGYIDFWTDGYYNGGNTGFGYQTLTHNTGAGFNSAFGYQSLLNNVETFNSAFGYRALFSNTLGTLNTAVGALTLYNNTNGSTNVAIGASALLKNISGHDNVGIGFWALHENKVGRYNTAVGNYSLSYTIGDNNTAIGWNTLKTNTTGEANTANGLDALYFNTKGNYNTADGISALYGNTTGNENTAVGNHTLSDNFTGNYNTALGSYANVNTRNLTNSTAIGYSTIVDTSNKVRIGNTSVTSIGGQVGWTNYSDERVKQDVKENVPGLAFIKALRPLTYHFSVAKENELMGRKDTAKWDSKYDIEKIQFTGFIAQEVDKAAKSINYDFSGIDKSGKIMGLRYSEFVVPLVKAVQELSQQNDNLKKENDELKTRLDKIETALSMQSQTSSQVQLESGARLEQNIPNPYNASTNIAYYLPVNNGNAYINFYSSNGSLLKTIRLSGTGKGALTIKSNELPSGVHQYALMVDGKIADKKQMMQAK